MTTAFADVSTTPVTDLLSLTGRRAVVTGGAQGLGKAIACRLAEAGANVLIGDVNEQRAQAAAVEITERFAVRAVVSPWTSPIPNQSAPGRPLPPKSPEGSIYG